MSIVSCLKVPRHEKYYVCFTDDYRVIQSEKFLRSRVPLPKPPDRICRIPDVFQDLGSPQTFAKSVGVPCRLTVPCVIYRKIDEREVADIKVNDSICYEVATSIPPPENAVAYPTWDLIEQLMDTVQHHTKFGSKVYRSCVFIGKRRAYPAPWTATKLIYDTMRALIELSYLDKRFETEIVEKYNTLEISSVIARERFGKIYHVGFNFYEHNNRYEAVMMFWTSSDRAARKYALFLWDLHFDYAMKIIEIMNKLPDAVKLKVENYRNIAVLGVPYWRTYFELKGYSINDVKNIGEIIFKSPIVGTPLDVDLDEKFYLVLKWLIKEVSGYEDME